MATSQDAWAAFLMGKLLLIAAMVLLLDDGKGHHRIIPLQPAPGEWRVDPADGQLMHPVIGGACHYVTPRGDTVSGICPVHRYEIVRERR
jgi:hypothetical protein